MKRPYQNKLNHNTDNETERADRRHVLETYRQVVQSVREARSIQGVLEKEQQMRRLLRYLRRRPATW